MGFDAERIKSDGSIMSETSMRRMRLRKILTYAVAFAAFGLGYGIWVWKTGLAMPCLFRSITGFRCPGCGMTRMCVALLHLDFESAFHYNQVLFFLMPVLGIIFLIDAVGYVKTGRWSAGRIQNYIFYASIIAMVAFGVLRNILPL